MDYVETSHVLRALVQTIEKDVIPHVGDSFARSQVWAATGLLGNIANDLERDGSGGSVGEDLTAFLGGAGLESALQDGDHVAEAAERIRDDLDQVIGGHVSLHYRRAVAGFEDAK
jgi:hypothetical protein